MAASRKQRGRRFGFSRRTKPDSRRAPDLCQLGFETLESRRMLVVAAAAIFPDTVNPGAGFNGVVQVFGSGTLLSTGQHVLTAAHVVDLNSDGLVDNVPQTVTFHLPGRTVVMSVPAANITVHNQYDGDFFHGSDIAIMELPKLAPLAAERRSIYRDRDEVGQPFTFLGYGATNRVNSTPNEIVPGPAGTIAPGSFSHDGSFGVKRIGFNVVDSVLLQTGGTAFDEYLEFDLDDPSGPTPGLAGEATSAPGDSGGPLLLGGMIAGVSSGGILSRAITRASHRSRLGSTVRSRARSTSCSTWPNFSASMALPM